MIPAGLKTMFGRPGRAAAASETPSGEVPVAPSPSTGPTPEPAAPEAAKPEPEHRAAKLVEGAKAKSGPAVPAWMAAAATAARRTPAIPAAALTGVAALALGYGVGLGGRGAGDAARWQQAQSEIHQTRDETVRLAQDLRSVRTALDAVRQERDKARGELLAKQALLGEKLDRLSQDGSARMAKLGEQVERLGREASRKDAPEKTASASPTPPPKPAATATTAPVPDVAQTGSIDGRKSEPEARKARLEGFFVRDYDDGFALVELRNGGYMDAAIGYVIPGAGKVEAIERRGRQWVVVTSKGFIGER